MWSPDGTCSKGDGKISAEDFGTAMNLMGVPTLGPMVAKVVDAYDTANRERLDYREIVKIMHPTESRFATSKTGKRQ